ncbi:hypothetical protein [Roseobacter weihaiensis]|uniref:hypothetical protein n=1 Tax=Roseobacter weihaiensis TaxID=2763262 RepID=UPI001D09F232|nr:hypothetical protein [Roseobacter sp. H9]
MSSSEGKQAGRIQGLFSLLEAAITVGTAFFIIYARNIDPFTKDLTGAQRILPGLVSAAILTMIGVSAWRTSGTFFDGTRDGAGEGAEELPDGEGGVGGSRLSVRLRHHSGPVFTIPFSSMGTIQNHSRDWVAVKLSFEVSLDE